MTILPMLASFVPVFSGVMVSCGQTATAAVYSGMFLSVAFFTSQMIVQVGLPLLLAGASLTAKQLTGMASFL